MLEDLELASHLALTASNALDTFKKENPIPSELNKRKQYGKDADKYSHNLLMKEFQI